MIVERKTHPPSSSMMKTTTIRSSNISKKKAGLAAAILLWWGHHSSIMMATADLVLSERIMKLSRTAALLSALAYEEDPAPGSSFDYFGYYDMEPDQALVAQKNGYCFGVYRGTSPTWEDWKQNLLLGTEEICPTKPGFDDTSCCSTRTGFWQAYNTDYRDKMEQSLRECAQDCINKDECVVLTGHSQGGAIAAVAAVYLADLNPLVFTFGQPPTIDLPCPVITSERWYRFINTKSVEHGVIGITYDPIPFAPSMGIDSWGHMIILSDDTSHVAYIGLDAQDTFGPLNVNGFEAHSMIHANGTTFPGYLDRIDTIMRAYENKTYPIVSTGFVATSLCSQDIECASGHCGKETGFSYNRCIGTACKRDEECDTGRCDSGVCIPKLGSCQVCDEAADCLSGTCSALFRCSGEKGLMDDDCACVFNADCLSGRCEGINPRICEAQLGLDAYCNEGSDCVSGFCSWKFRCEKKPASSWWSGSKSLQEVVDTNAVASAVSKAIDLESVSRDSNKASGVSKKDESTSGASDAFDGDAVAKSKEQGKNATMKIAIATLGVLALVVGIGRWWYLKTRRYGYEEVPAQLVV